MIHIVSILSGRDLVLLRNQFSKTSPPFVRPCISSRFPGAFLITAYAYANAALAYASLRKELNCVSFP